MTPRHRHRQQHQRLRHAGVREHAIALETAGEAERFHKRLVNACIRANTQDAPLAPEQLQVAIIGAGATGTELAAELHKTTRQLVAFGLDRIDPDKDIKIHLIEAAPRILPACPNGWRRPPTSCSRASACASTPVRGSPRWRRRACGLADGTTIPAELVVWSAGVKAPDFLRDIGGLETNRINQLVVRPTLQTTRDDAIFAIGDCAACPVARTRPAGAAARAGGAPAGLASGKAVAALSRGPAAQRLALSRLSDRWCRSATIPRSAA
jgi:NADH dehydrogenase